MSSLGVTLKCSDGTTIESDWVTLAQASEFFSNLMADVHPFPKEVQLHEDCQPNAVAAILHAASPSPPIVSTSQYLWRYSEEGQEALAKAYGFLAVPPAIQKKVARRCDVCLRPGNRATKALCSMCETCWEVEAIRNRRLFPAKGSVPESVVEEDLFETMGFKPVPNAAVAALKDPSVKVEEVPWVPRSRLTLAQVQAAVAGRFKEMGTDSRQFEDEQRYEDIYSICKRMAAPWTYKGPWEGPVLCYAGNFGEWPWSWQRAYGFTNLPWLDREGQPEQSEATTPSV